jgi:hypothetical protein
LGAAHEHVAGRIGTIDLGEKGRQNIASPFTPMRYRHLRLRRRRLSRPKRLRTRRLGSNATSCAHSTGAPQCPSRVVARRSRYASAKLLANDRCNVS